MILDIPLLTSLLIALSFSPVLAITSEEATNAVKRAATPGKLRVVENNGVCETTPGVYQASGYGDLTSDESMWFWFFAARNNPDSAPLSLWLNGGPGSSSMVGLFQENGPCRITNDSSDVTLNPNSWNEVSNMLYIDQPIGTGFSHGTTTVGTSQEAAADVWTFLQIFFADPRFAPYQKNDFAIWTESYGGHYGPTFVTYFLSQNAAIANGTVAGVPINVKVLGIGDGLIDPLTQYASYLTYSVSNPYYPLAPDATVMRANTSWSQSGGCRDSITDCYDGVGDEFTCARAHLNCDADLTHPLAGPYDPYYVLAKTPDAYPPDLTPYLNDSALMARIGAESQWLETNRGVFNNFELTGEWMKNSRPELEAIIDAGIRTILYAGDADFLFNYQGMETMIDSFKTKSSSEWAAQEFANYTVKGEVAGLFKNAGTFSYVRMFGAGHEVPAYTHGSLSVGEAALQMFSQIMSDAALLAT